MSVFVNTVDSIGDEALTNSIIDKSITEIKDNLSTSIGNYAFYTCSALTTADFPAVTSIGTLAFGSCSNLTTADFPAATSIGEQAFRSCSALTAVNFPVATSIGNSSFQSCSALTTADFPAATSIGRYAFMSCSALTTLILRSETMVTLNGSEAIPNTVYIYVPSALVDTYTAGFYWGNFAAKIRAIEDYPEVCDPYSWEAVAKHIELGDYATFYKVGDCVPLDLGSEGVVNMQIAAFDADDLADGSGKAPISWISKELLATSHRMNPSLVTNDDGTYQEGTGTIGGWEKSEMRTYLKETIKPLIPDVVRANIKSVTKTHPSYNSAGSSETQTSTDDVWIPSYVELFGNSSAYHALFEDTSDKRIKMKVGSTNESTYWLRSASSKNYFFYVIKNGSGSVNGGYNTCDIALGFCT